MTSIATTWGSTPAERELAFPCDAYLGEPHVLFRAITIAAPPPTVFRWLCQLKVAPYSYDLLDNFGRTSPRTLTPGAEHLARGQRVMSIFELVDFVQDRHLTLILRKASALFGEIALSYVVQPIPEGGSRLVVKLRVKSRGDGVFAKVQQTLLAWGDLVMMRKQLLTLKRLAERSARG